MATLKDVAELAGVSIAAVSLYINGKANGRVSPETQRKIEQAVIESGYAHGSHTGRSSLSTPIAKTTKTIAIFWSIDFRRDLLGSAMRGIQEAIIDAGLDTEDYDFVIRPYKNNHLYLQKRHLCSRQYHAALLVSLSSMDLEFLQSIDPPIPIVLVNRIMKQFHCIYIDNATVADQAAELILQKGYRDICFITCQTSYMAMNSRNMEFINACRKKGIRISNEFHIFTENSIKGGISAAKEYLSFSNRPAMVFAATDQIAFGFSRYLLQHGVRIPKDCALFCYGFEREELTEYAYCPISSIDISTYMLTNTGMQLIMDILNKGISVPQHIEVSASIFLRDSF